MKISQTNPILNDFFSALQKLTEYVKEILEKYCQTDQQEYLVKTVLQLIMKLDFRDMTITHKQFANISKYLKRIKNELIDNENRYLFQTIQSVFDKIQWAYSQIDLSQFEDINETYESFYESIITDDDITMCKTLGEIKAEKLKKTIDEMIQKVGQEIIQNNAQNKALITSFVISIESMVRNMENIKQKQKQQLQAAQSIKDYYQDIITESERDFDNEKEKAENIKQKYDEIQKSAIDLKQLQIDDLPNQYGQLENKYIEMAEQIRHYMEENAIPPLQMEKLDEIMTVVNQHQIDVFDQQIALIQNKFKDLQDKYEQLQKQRINNQALEFQIKNQRQQIERNFDQISQMRLTIASAIKNFK